MPRGGYRRGRRTLSLHQHNLTDVNNNFQPILNHLDKPNKISELHREHENRPLNRKNSSRVSRNRGVKPQLMDKNEEEDSTGVSDSNFDDVIETEDNSADGSNSRLNSDSNCDDNIEKDEISAIGSVSRLILDSNNGEIEICTDDIGKGMEKVEELNSSDEQDPVKRLEELIKLSIQEVELSEELLSINNQLQEDELLALESIYGDNLFILDDLSGLRCFQVHIHVEVPKGVSVSTKFNSSNFNEEGVGSSQDITYSLSVEFIPPIILTCLLPRWYPSNNAPFFTISVQWLNSDKISSLCCKLDSIWQEQAGQEVLYQWVEWLQDCTFSHLSLGNEIVLGPYGVEHNDDRRAISGIKSPDMDLLSMKTYNDEQLHESFCRSIQECCICFSEFPGSEFIKLPCQHFFCWKCLKTFTGIHITDGTVLKIQCPESKCEGMIPPGLLKRLLGDEEFKRWESMMLRKTLESMSDVVYCPRCETACIEDDEDLAQCSKCFYSFCTICSERWHLGVACTTPEVKLEFLKERQKSKLMRDEQRRRETDMINQLLSIKEINRFAKQCPSCKMAISRVEGCNKMVCKNCGEYFCYLCNQAIEGYEHFREGSCVLFPADEIQRWEEMDRRQAAAPAIQVNLFAQNGHRCPNCRQNNAKVGQNNHIFCWACQNHYCYLCGQTVRRASQHYGPKGCKQHTVG